MLLEGAPALAAPFPIDGELPENLAPFAVFAERIAALLRFLLFDTQLRPANTKRSHCLARLPESGDKSPPLRAAAPPGGARAPSQAHRWAKAPFSYVMVPLPS